MERSAASQKMITNPGCPKSPPPDSGTWDSSGSAPPGKVEPGGPTKSGGCVRFACGSQNGGMSRRGDYRENAGVSGLHPANFPRAERSHPLPRVIDLASAVETHLVRLLLQRERPRLPAVPASKHQVVEEPQQRMYPIHNEQRSFRAQLHRANPPSAHTYRCIVPQNVSFVVGKIHLWY